MVNSILHYIEPQLKAYMQFLNRVDSPVFRISTGEMIKGNGQEKEVVTISDLNGNSLYIRQTQPETINERKALSSCDKEYNISARCKVVFYTFGGNDFTINPDKVKSKIVNTLARLDFSHYTGTSSEIKIDVNGTSLDIEKIYTEETGKEFTGNVWPTLVSVDFTLSYVDTNCNTCDIDDSETVVTWTPDLTPENCETKAICEVISKCDVITLLQEQTASLQEQIDNLPQSGLTCTDLPNCQTIIDILQSINDIISGLPSSYFSCADLEFCQTIIDIVSDISALQTQVGTNTTDISTLQGQVSSLISDLGTLTTTVNNHISDTNNPHNVTATQIGLGDVDNTSDINKPVSTAQATAIGLKEDSSNKSTSVVTDQTSNTKYPSVKSVYDWVIGLGYLTSAAAVLTYQAILSSANFGSFITGLTTKNPPVDEDEFAFNDVAGGNLAKKSTWLQIKTAIATAFYLDATSSIQTQLNSKQSATTGAFIKSLIKQNTTISHTGTTSETKLYSVLIPSGTMNANDILEYYAWIISGSGSGNRTVKVYLNTSDAIGGIQIATYTFTTTSTIFKRKITFKNSLSIQEIIPAGTTNLGNGEASSYAFSNVSSIAANFNNNVWFVISMTLATGTDNVSIYSIGSNILR